MTTTARGWPMVRLGEVLEPVTRPEKVELQTVYRLLGARWYAKGLYIKDEKPGSEIRANTVYRVEAGDFVYNRLFAWMGSFALADDTVHGCHVSNEFPCFRVKADRLDGRYLSLYFQQRESWSEALGLSSGGTPTSRNRLKEAKLLGMSVPLPSLAEQRRIVARVDAVAGRIADARRLRAEATEERTAILHAVSRRLIGSEPGDGWQPLSTFVERIENGWSPNCQTRPAEGDEWGVLKVGAVSLGYFDPGENKALPPGLAPMPEYEVRPGDFIMSRANTTELTGACAVVTSTPPRLMLSDKHFRFVFRSAPRIDRNYLDWVLKSPAVRRQIEIAVSGTSSSMKNISKEKVLGLLLPPHAESEQQRIAARLHTLQSRLKELELLQEDSAAELDALLPAVLSKAFAGQL